MWIMEGIMNFREMLPRSHRLIGGIIGGACMLAGIVGQLQAGTGSSALPPADVISARKTLMNAIARNMYPLDEMSYTGRFNMPRGRNTDQPAMLQAFPLLSASTNTGPESYGILQPIFSPIRSFGPSIHFSTRKPSCALQHMTQAAPKTRRSSGSRSLTCA
jgi:hypothetical protein